MSDQIRAQVSRILSNCEVTYSAAYVGATTRDKWECDAWRVTFQTTRNGRAVSETFDYFTGVGHRAPAEWKPGAPFYDGGQKPRPGSLLYQNWHKSGKPQEPDAADVLHCLILDASAVGQSFTSWCEEFGYDEDSRKAEATYRACQENADKLARVFDSVALEALRDALQDY